MQAPPACAQEGIELSGRPILVDVAVGGPARSREGNLENGGNRQARNPSRSQSLYDGRGQRTDNRRDGHSADVGGVDQDEPSNATMAAQHERQPDTATHRVTNIRVVAKTNLVGGFDDGVALRSRRVKRVIRWLVAQTEA